MAGLGSAALLPLPVVIYIFGTFIALQKASLMPMLAFPSSDMRVAARGGGDGCLPGQETHLH